MSQSDKMTPYRSQMPTIAKLEERVAELTEENRRLSKRVRRLESTEVTLFAMAIGMCLARWL